ncbi:hypothetical protein M9458_014344, partial [Cirrhinus mrigala]
NAIDVIHGRLRGIDLPAFIGHAGIVSCQLLILMRLPFEFLLELFLMYLLILRLLR